MLWSTDSRNKEIKKAKYFCFGWWNIWCEWNRATIYLHPIEVFEIQEDFLGFCPLEKQDAASLTHAILPQLNKWGLPVSFLQGWIDMGWMCIQWILYIIAEQKEPEHEREISLPPSHLSCSFLWGHTTHNYTSAIVLYIFILWLQQHTHTKTGGVGQMSWLRPW